jgi:hypothetical protein
MVNGPYLLLPDLVYASSVLGLTCFILERLSSERRKITFKNFKE